MYLEEPVALHYHVGQALRCCQVLIQLPLVWLPQAAFPLTGSRRGEGERKVEQAKCWELHTNHCTEGPACAMQDSCNVTTESQFPPRISQRCPGQGIYSPDILSNTWPRTAMTSSLFVYNLQYQAPLIPAKLT